MQTVRHRSIAAFGAILATTVSILGVSPAHAAAYDAAATTDVRQATVSLAGAPLSSPEGRAVIDRRIRSAAVRVCGRMDLQAAAATQSCRRAAIADARARLDSRAGRMLAAR